MLKHKEHADVMQADLAAAVVPKKKKKMKQTLLNM